MRLRNRLALVLAASGALLAQRMPAQAPPSTGAGAPTSAPELRLGDAVVPLAERLKLRLDPAAPDYRGSAEIELRLPSPQARIRLHAQEMDLWNTSVRPRAGGEAVHLEPHALQDGVVELQAPRALAAGDYVLSIDFHQEFDAHSVGIYHVEADGKHYVFTQLEAADARHSFPCWDEPEFKIPWTLELTVPAGLTAATNSPVVSTTADEKSGEQTVLFAPTPALPSYLVAIAVGPFDVVEVPGLSVPGRILTAAGQGQLASLAREMEPALLAGLERWFGQRYPFDKLDLVAVPEFWPGAMENPGLITFADRILLAPAQGASARDRRDLATVLTHEMAHMWFGDLVTMKWWDDLWLNESFADWMGNRVSDQVFPALGIADDELGGVQMILDADARPSAPAVRQPIARAGDALGNVGLAYAKGRSVLAMVERWLGADTFQRGVRSYLQAHARGNATGDDLWGALGKAAASDRQQRRDVSAVMRGFLDQPGYPLVSVDVVDAKTGKLQLSQSRFHAAGVELPAQRWQVPVALKWSDGKQVRTREVLLDRERQTVELGSPIAWVYPNAGAAGYYRWQVPAPALTALAAEAPARLDVAERIALLGNAAGLLDAGVLGGDDYLRIVGAAVGDPDPAVVVAALEGLSKVELAFVTPELREPFAAYVRRTVGPALARVGNLPKKDSTQEGEPEAVALLRPQLLEWLAATGRDPAVRAFAREQADAYLADPKAVPADVAGIMLRLAALDGDAALFETYRQRFEAAKDPGEQARFLRALGAFERPELVQRALDYVLAGPLRDRDIGTIPAVLRARPEHADAVFAWARDHWPAIVARMPPELVPFYASVAGGCSEERLAAAREFFAAPERSTPQLQVRLGRAADQVTQCVALRQREGARVAALLRAGGDSAASAASAGATSSAPAAASAAPAAPTPAAAGEVRLGEDVVPTAERLQLRLDPAETTYIGTAEIALEVRRPTRSFAFHAEAMDLGILTLNPVGDQRVALEASPTIDDLIEVTAKEPLQPGRYELRVEFRNDFGTRTAGLYRAVVDGKGYLFTDFETADAREAFPCFDEPGFKIPWTVELMMPAGLVAAANNPIASTRSDQEGWETITFAETPPLPSYLVAFTVGPFDVVDVPGTSIPTRILTVAGQAKNAAMARASTAPLLAGLEKWFGQRYPFAKLDFVAVPEYGSGAMENPGLITFLDRILLTSPEGASLAARSRFADVAAHELAHMWFGDLVTMKWWDDLWLNEGFADWLGPKVADEAYPDFGIGNDMLASIQGTLSSDARPSAPAVRRPVPRAKDVFSNADLTYAKGRAVLGMVEQWLGPETFRRGVQGYVQAHAGGNATAADLWQALEQASHQDVTAVMGSFLDKPGFPLLSVEVVDPARGVVEIAQRRFVALGSQAAAASWQVPVVLAWSDGARRQTRPLLLTAERQRVELGGPVTWLFPNAGGQGYYRWSLPPAMLADLAAHAGERLTVPERIALLGNVAGLLDAGAIGGDEYLRVLGAAAADSDPHVLEAVLSGLERVETAFVTDALREPFARYVRRTLRPALDRIGELPRKSEPAAVGLLRPKLLAWLGDDGRDPQARQLGKRLTQQYVERPASVDPGLVTTALELAALDGDAALFDTYRQRFETATSSEERGWFLTALGRFGSPELAEKALAYTLSGPLRPQELRTVAFSMVTDEARRDQAFAWVLANWTPLVQRLPPDRIASLTRFAGGCSAERLAAGRDFFLAPERRTDAIAAQLARVGDQVAECVALRQREGAKVATWLTAGGR